MPSQENTGRQFDKRHAVTQVAQADIAAYRFVTYSGKHATGEAPNSPEDTVQGVSEYAVAAHAPLSVVTDYSYPVEAGEAIDLGAYVKPGADGKAMAGDVDTHCGRALGAATDAGALIEVQILPHVYTATTG